MEVNYFFLLFCLPLYVVRCKSQDGCPDDLEAGPQYQCSAGPCIPEEWRCDDIIDCPQADDEMDCEVTNGSTTVTSQATDETTTEMVDNTTTIEITTTEEMTTTESTTTSTSEPSPGECVPGSDQFQCTFTTCIPREWLCDGLEDCENGRDEVNCPETEETSTSTIETTTGTTAETTVETTAETTTETTTTTPSPGLCEDDLNSSGQQFRCSRLGPCVPMIWVCDGVVDCANGRDENGCRNESSTTTTTMPTTTEVNSCELPGNTYRCTRRGPCIPRDWRCDGIRDCPNGRDERRCRGSTVSPSPRTTTPTTTAIPICEVYEFTCVLAPPTSDFRCISLEGRCNGSVECPLGTDELRCPTTSTTTPGTTGTTNSCENKDNTFYCGIRGPCVPRDWVCDGVRDCPNGRDERRCRTTTPQTATTAVAECDFHEFICHLAPASAPRDLRCIPAYKVCDNVADCPYETDELRCPSTTTEQSRRTKSKKKRTKKGSKKKTHGHTHGRKRTGKRG